MTLDEWMTKELPANVCNAVQDIIDEAGTSDASHNVLEAAGWLVSDLREKLATQKLLNAELRRVEAPRLTLELLVRLGYEMECLSTSRCAELLGESVQEFRERGWVQSRIRDALSECTETLPGRAVTTVISQIIKDFE